MKKVLVFVFALMMCLFLCACESETQESQTQESEIQRETVSLEQLKLDTENPAKVKLNGGKQTKLFGQINRLSSESCTVSTFLSNFHFSVSMPTSALAEASEGQFVMLDVVLEDRSTEAFFQDYFATATEFIDLTKKENQEIMDQYVRDLCGTASKKYSFSQEVNINMLANYMQARGNAFQKKTDDELKSYLIGGTWTFEDGDTIVFQEDGIYEWRYYDVTTVNGRVVSSHWEDQHSDWSVENGQLNAIWGYGRSIYIVSENYCFAYDLLMKRK